MRVYHERLTVPLSWWLVGLATIVILATEVVPGWPLPVEVLGGGPAVNGSSVFVWNIVHPEKSPSDTTCA
jgi:hypothetical protein